MQRGIAQTTLSPQRITDVKHPRILLLAGEEDAIWESVHASAEWGKMHKAIVVECNRIIPLPPVERIQIGRRLLDKSREALRRIFQLSYAFRMTGEQKYLARAEKELLAVSGFTDWNPSHFLDVAEMTMAVAIGYDWLYDALPESSRKTIREAIVEKGLKLSRDTRYNSWLKAEHNWNQVCNAGMTYGALAVAEDYPELAVEIIGKAIQSIPKAMESYNPDGAYPEGFSYWGYGTSFNVMYLSAMEKVFNEDFGLLDPPGFLKTGGFLQNMTGTTNLCFNWGDCGLRGGLNPAMFWIAVRNNDPSLLWVEKSYLSSENYDTFTRDRLLPAIMIWGKDVRMKKIKPPKATAWMGQGANPVAMMRTSWKDPEAIFLGFKAGSPSVNHGHMDIGSFIMESEGIRWASDFGMQEYESLESKGIAVFGRTQDAQRWTIFRLNNRVHNTLTIDDQLQLVKGYARIDKFSDNRKFMYARSDISSVYEGLAESVWRGAAIVNGRYVVIRDEVTGGSKNSVIRWTMLTSATPEIRGNTIILTKDGKKLTLKVETNAPVTMKTWSTAPGTTYDAPNPGTVLVGFEYTLPAGTPAQIEVLLIPGKTDPSAIKFNKPLAAW